MPSCSGNEILFVNFQGSLLISHLDCTCLSIAWSFHYYIYIWSVYIIYIYICVCVCIYIYISMIISNATAAAAKSFQSCLTLCDPIDGSPPGSPFPGILQARTLEWVVISLSNAWKWKVKVKSLSHVWLLATPWTTAHQAPPTMGFSRQEYWSGVPLPSLTYQ